MSSFTIREEGKRYSVLEEILNSITHGIGTCFSVFGLVLLLVRTAAYHNAWKIVSCCIYGSSLILLFLMSTLYHALTKESAKELFRVFDHATIFILIAGTYTPVVLVSLRGVYGWVLFGLVWAASILGVVFTCIDLEKYKTYSMICYIATGWAIIGAIKPLLSALDLNGFLLLLSGGISYMIGLIFYSLKNYKYMHTIWHLMILLGAYLHFVCIYYYVMIV